MTHGFRVQMQEAVFAALDAMITARLRSENEAIEALVVTVKVCVRACECV